MNPLSMAFTPGNQLESAPLPLGRYLPPLPPGMVNAWLEKNIPAHSWILDPVGASPALALEAAAAGYRVLVVCNNPVLAFLLEVLASAPQSADLQSALADLASSRRGDDRLEVHLQSLYLTPCEACGRFIPAQAFLWKRGATEPYARIYECPHCGDDGEHAITPSDLERLSELGGDALHRARALGRVDVGDKEMRENAEEALTAYLPRPLNLLFTLLNKIDGLAIISEKRRWLQALALSVCDDATSLWDHPTERTRPRQISIPTQFRENNLWLAMENAARLWASNQISLPLTQFPQLPPPQGGICLLTGRLRQVFPLPVGVEIKAVLSALPRPSQAFWTLSALWSGWLWGKESVLPMKSALERKRYDWNWHTQALSSLFESLGDYLPTGTCFQAILTDLAPGFLGAALTAGQSSGFSLEGLALQAEEEIAQVLWRVQKPMQTTPSLRSPGPMQMQMIYLTAIEQELALRNQPANYLPLYAASLVGLEQNHLLAIPGQPLNGETFTHLNSAISAAFTQNSALTRYLSSAQNLESGLWWLAEPLPQSELPLMDRIEMEFIRQMQRQSPQSAQDMQTALCAAFPGLLTPSTQEIHELFKSYCEPAQTDWKLRESELSAARRADLASVQKNLVQLAKLLNYKSEGENPILWSLSDGQPVFMFFLLASSIISRFVLAPQPLPFERCVLVFPASRSNLITSKLGRDPRLAASAGWHFLKYRTLLEITERETLTQEQFLALLDSDPPFDEEGEQLRMFH